jgi:hypothetical protein
MVFILKPGEKIELHGQFGSPKVAILVTLPYGEALALHSKRRIGH